MGTTIPIRDFERAYRSEAAYVAALMGRLSVPDEAIKDAVQDVFVAAYRRWPEFDRSRAVRPWLTGFARHVAFRYRRSAARRHRRGLALAVEHRDRAEPGPHHRANARDFLTRFLATLNPGHRRAFLLAEYEGLTGPGIAETLGISMEAAYGRVRAARRRLKQALMAEVGRGDPRAAAFVPPWSLVLARLQVDAAAATAITAASIGGAGGLTLGLTGVVLASVVGFAVAWGTQGPSSRTPARAHDGAAAVTQRAAQSRPERAAGDPVGQVAMRTGVDVPPSRPVTSVRTMAVVPAADRRRGAGRAQERSPTVRRSGAERNRIDARRRIGPSGLTLGRDASIAGGRGRAPARRQAVARARRRAARAGATGGARPGLPTGPARRCPRAHPDPGPVRPGSHRRRARRGLAHGRGSTR